MRNEVRDWHGGQGAEKIKKGAFCSIHGHREVTWPEKWPGAGR